jgi:tetratricopeptide (TPR) repeat protein
MQNKIKKPQPKNFIFYIYLLLAASTLLVFWQVRDFDFITFDDTGYVLENPHVTTGLKMNNIIWAFTTGHAANWHPLTWLSLMFDCQLFGPNPGWLHLESVLLHILNTLLLFAVLKKMTAALWPSAFVAAAFALHPMHVESVAWIAERKDVLSTFFFMLTLLAYCRYTQQQNKGRYFLVLLTFAFGLMTKPMLVTLPFVLLLLDYWPLNRFEAQAVKLSRRQNGKSARPIRAVLKGLIIEKIPFFVLVLASSIITFFVQRSSGAVVDINYISLQRRLANAFAAYAEYIGKMLWPANLAIFYPFPEAGLPFWQIVICVLLLAIISLFVIRFGRGRKYLPVGWFWFLGTLVPVIGVVQVGVQAYADRYTYIAYIGLFIMIAWGVSELLSKWACQRIVLGVSMVIVLTLLGICTFRQISYWKNSNTVFSHALEVTQNNYIAHNCLGEYYLRQGELTLAIQECTKAIKINPAWANAYINLGSALAKEGKYVAALDQFRQAVELNPDIAGAHYNLGKALGTQGQFDEALEQFQATIRLEPDWPAPMNDFAFLVVTHPELKSRDVNEAIRLASRVCVLTNYTNAAFLSTLAVAYSSANRFSEAVQTLETALNLDPNSAALHNGLGDVLLSQGKFKEAIGQMKRSLEIEPNNPDAKSDMAWILATCPDSNMRNPSEAIRLAQEACIATNYKKASKLDTLGAAYASAGRFAEAIEAAQKALSLVDKSQPGLLKTIQGHLDLYKTSRPYIYVLPRGKNAK